MAQYAAIRPPGQSTGRAVVTILTGVPVASCCLRRQFDRPVIVGYIKIVLDSDAVDRGL